MRRAIRISSLDYSYPGSGAVLHNVNLKIDEGEFVLVLGASGSGKSTLLRAMYGAVPHLYGGTFDGDVEVFGRNTKGNEPKELAGIIGAVFQDPEAQLIMTDPENEIEFGLENLSFPASEIATRCDEAMRLLNIEEHKGRFVPDLSGGEKQKLVIASAIAPDLRVLVLDEPTSQLDPKSAEEILSLLRKFNEERGLTVILTEHRLERCMQFADRVVLMESGRIRRDEGMNEYLAWAGKSGSTFIPPVARISPPWTTKAPATVKEARRIVAGGLAGGRVGRRKGKKIVVGRKTLVSMRKVSFEYEPGKSVIEGLKLDVRKGERIALLGRNGAGKSTLLKLLCGHLKPKKGSIKVMGRDTKSLPTSMLAGACGYLSQNPSDYLFQKTVERELFVGADEDEKTFERIAMLVEMLGLKEHLNTYPRDLSTGERERLALGAVLARGPRIIALDEPTRGMDYQCKERLVEILAEFGREGCSSIVATHDVEFAASFANRVIIIGDGGILMDGVPKKVLSRSLLFAPQASLATRGFGDMGLEEGVLRPEELVWREDNE